jgi:hypothetical protein
MRQRKLGTDLVPEIFGITCFYSFRVFSTRRVALIWIFEPGIGAPISGFSGLRRCCSVPAANGLVSSVKAQIGHGIVLAVAGPEGGLMADSRGGDEGDGNLDAVALAVLRRYSPAN